MAYTQYSQGWLEDPAAIRGIFAEVVVYDVVAAQDVTKYISTLGYITTDASVSYLPIIVGGVQITESLPLDGQATLSFGDIELNNVTMDLDPWLDITKYIWANKSIKVYLGDPTWVCANISDIHTKFELIFDGIVNDIDSKSPTSLNLKIRDKLERLNTPITESKLGVYGTWASGQTNKETIRPIAFGEVHNVQPLLIDPATLEYLISDGSQILNVTSIASTTNLICDTTSILTTNTPIVFNPITIDNTTSILGITFGTTYYVKTIVDSTTFTISATSGGTVLSLTNGTCNLIGTIESYSTERIIELRDNGVPLSTPTVSLTTGKAKLGANLAGTLTASVQGVKNSVNLSTGALVVGTYKNNIANLIALIVTQYGKYTSRLNGATELDLVNLAAFETANPQSVGLYITDRTNTLVACQELAASIGAQVFINRKGLLQLLRIGSPISTSVVPEVAITTADIIHHSLNITNRLPVQATVKLGYCRNYTVQNGLLTAIPQIHKTMFETEWFTKTATNYSTKKLYTQNTDPDQKDTLLLVGTEAMAEATRLQTYFNTPHTVYGFTGTSKLLSLKLGQQVNLTYPRFGMNSGVTGQVVGLTPNWLKSTIEVEVLV